MGVGLGLHSRSTMAGRSVPGFGLWSILGVGLLLVSAPGSAAEGASAPDADGVNEVSLSLTAMGAEIGYGRLFWPPVRLGISVGGGVDCLGHGAFTGHHFDDAGAACTESHKGGVTNWTEYVWSDLWARAHAARWIFVEGGVHASMGMHTYATSDDAYHLFQGVRLGVFVGGDHLAVGTRLLAGSFGESFGLWWLPLHVRLALAW
jgi:hypothetical protein